MEQLTSFVKKYRNILIAVGVLLAVILVIYFSGIAGDFVNTYQDNKEMKKQHAEQSQKLAEANAKIEAADKLIRDYQLIKGDANALKPLLEQINQKLTDLQTAQESLDTKLDIQSKKADQTRDAYRDAVDQLRNNSK